MIVNIEHSNHPINLPPSFGFPDHLEPHKGKTFKYSNVNQESFYINISMLSGLCNMFIDIKPEITPNNAKKSYFLSKD